MIGISIFLGFLLSQVILAEDDDTDFVLPTPKFTTNNIEPEILTTVDGCTFKTDRNRTIICSGFGCTIFKALKPYQPETLKIKTTRITVFHKEDFQFYSNLQALEIQSNLQLTRFEPGCFHNMTSMTNLSISINRALKYLDFNVFEGLINLQELYLFKNGFTNIIDITKALQPKYVPNLLRLFLNDNVFKNVYKDDFKPMANSKLECLQLIFCQIDFLHPECFNPLINLRNLSLGQNQFNISSMENLLTNMIKQRIPLKSLSLKGAGYFGYLPYSLLEKIAIANITNLNLGRNIFGNVSAKSFPFMPKIAHLDLSDCLLLDVAKGSFDNLPNLKTLLLNDNRLSYISLGMTLKQLKIFDISKNSDNQVSRSYFRIDDNIFMNMINLLVLILDYNLITQITSYTFTGLENLRYLSLKNATIFSVEIGAFRQLKHLQYLNLENNKFTVNITAEIFQGMNELKILLLGGCAIEYLVTNPSPFLFLPNLTFLGLQGNSLYSLSVNHFSNLINLQSLDLSVNKLIEWTDQTLTNPSLKALDLNQNKIKTITETMFEDFKYLETLNLDNNPFICDCLLYPAANWLYSRNYSPKFIHNNNFIAKCVNPDEWSQQSIITYMIYLVFHPAECVNLPINTEIIVIIVMSVFGALITIFSILGYIYRLHVRHWILLSRIALRRYMRIRKKDEGTEYTYDAFVSYSNEDKEFVEQMVTELEQYPPHFKLCVYERDFQIGTDISESVLQSVAASRRTLLIVSDAFVKSQWCRWEAKLAERHQLFFYEGDFQAPYGTLLIILLGKVCNTNLTPTLKYLLKTRIYLQWCDDLNGQKLFWHKLRKKLTAPNSATYETCLNEFTGT